MPAVCIHKDTIDAFEETGRKFFRDVLDMSWDEVLVTDLSELSDFRLSGDCSSAIPGATMSYRELCFAWDAWVKERIDNLYHLRLETTHITLIELFRKLEPLFAQPHLH